MKHILIIITLIIGFIPAGERGIPFREEESETGLPDFEFDINQIGTNIISEWHQTEMKEALRPAGKVTKRNAVRLKKKPSTARKESETR